jgi:hypothetical protein
VATLLAHRLDWYAIEAKASVDELVGTRVELSRAREAVAAAKTQAARARRRARRSIVAAFLLVAVLGAGAVTWYQTRPSTELFVGDRLRSDGNLASALRVYSARKRLLEASVARAPDDEALQQSLSVALNPTADVLEAQGRLAEALATFEAGKTIMVKLVAKSPDNADWQAERGARGV